MEDTLDGVGFIVGPKPVYHRYLSIKCGKIEDTKGVSRKSKKD